MCILFPIKLSKIKWLLFSQGQSGNYVNQRAENAIENGYNINKFVSINDHNLITYEMTTKHLYKIFVSNFEKTSIWCFVCLELIV